jgi:fatty-acyl-CoA synthase
MSLASSGVTYAQLILNTLSRYPEREAFVQDGRTYTYAQALDLLRRIRTVFANHGVGPGSAVGALGLNSPEIWLSEAAAWVAGARYTGLHALGSADDQVFVCDDAELSILVIDPAFADRAKVIANQTQTVKHIFTLGSCDIGKDLLALADQAMPAPLHTEGIDEEDTAWLQYTGGTTGQPKGALLPQRALVQQTQTVAISFGLPDRPRCLLASPITHAAVLPLLPTLVRGGTVVMQRSFDPDQWLRTVQDQRITYAFLVPTMIYALLDRADPGRYDLSSLTTILYGASPISPGRLVEAHDRIGPVFLQAYGQTENTGMTTTLLKEEHDPVRLPHLLESCGRPVIGVDARILDEAGNEVTVGEVGEICVRSRTVMNGYWKRPEETALVLRNAWLHTEDMGRQDENGYLYLIDRQKDLIITGGFNVYPKEIEDVLVSHPDVAIAAVIGVPHDRWGEAVTAFVVRRSNSQVDSASLIALVREKKGSVSAPKSVEFVDELPLTPVGKVDKKVLRTPYWQDQSRQVH